MKQLNVTDPGADILVMAALSQYEQERMSLGAFEKLEGTKELFDQFDTDRSGYLEIDEFASFFIKLYETGIINTEIDFPTILKEISILGDKKISFVEFKFWWEKEYTRILFDQYDTDKSGGLTHDEFARFFIAMFDTEIMERDFPETFQELDNDGNGTIDYPEFLIWWQKQKQTLYNGDSATLKHVEESAPSLPSEDYPLLADLSGETLLSQRARIIFDSYDTKPKDGLLDREEFASLYIAMFDTEFTEKDFPAAFNEIDNDGNGTIDFPEFLRFLEKQEEIRN